MATSQVIMAQASGNSNSAKEAMMLEGLQTFYENDANFACLRRILGKDSRVSLRSLDWLATNYAKRFNVVYSVHGRVFSMYSSYKSQLRAYSKRYFDPFQRKSRITFTVKGVSIRTTIGQCNFFRWAIYNDVIKYAIDNYARIEADMLRNERVGKFDSPIERYSRVDEAVKISIKRPAP